MMTEIDHPPITDRAFPTEATTNRALTTDRAAVQLLSPTPEPLNRRGRRHLAAQMRRAERRSFRSDFRELAELRAER